jgi:hypothetical protein
VNVVSETGECIPVCLVIKGCFDPHDLCIGDENADPIPNIVIEGYEGDNNHNNNDDNDDDDDADDDADDNDTVDPNISSDKDKVGVEPADDKGNGKFDKDVDPNISSDDDLSPVDAADSNGTGVPQVADELAENGDLDAAIANLDTVKVAGGSSLVKSALLSKAAETTPASKEVDPDEELTDLAMDVGLDASG